MLDTIAHISCLRLHYILQLSPGSTLITPGGDDPSPSRSAQRGTSGPDRQSKLLRRGDDLKADIQVEEKKKKAEAEVV